MQTIHLDTESLKFTLKRSTRARRIRLTLHPNGELVVTVPERLPTTRIDAFIETQRDWILHQRARLERQPAESLPELTRAHFLAHKATALLHVQGLIDAIARIHVFTYREVSIKRLRKRWGSCSRRGNLNFNYALLFLPHHVAEYVVVHELCHLRQLNHSTAFWREVESILPDYRERRARLRRFAIGEMD